MTQLLESKHERSLENEYHEKIENETLVFMMQLIYCSFVDRYENFFPENLLLLHVLRVFNLLRQMDRILGQDNQKLIQPNFFEIEFSFTEIFKR